MACTLHLPGGIVDSVIPSYLSLDGVDFPLFVRDQHVGLGYGARELEVLGFALDEMVNGDSRDVSIDELASRGFKVQELSAIPIGPEDSYARLNDGPINWRMLSGRWPDFSDSFFVRSGFLKKDLVIPRPVLMNLVAKLREFRDDLANGTRESRVSAELVPPPRPRTPELERYEQLVAAGDDEAWKLAEELYARRG
jgi:hypothetical protein